MHFRDARGNATILVLAMSLTALPAAAIPLSLQAAADARSRAAVAADMIAMNGCDADDALNIYADTDVVECFDDGVTVSVQTRTRLALPQFLGFTWFVHAQAQAVHSL